jgi:hypothetical protein
VRKVEENVVIVTRPDREKVETILKKTGMPIGELKCSLCGEPITDLSRIRAIFPYHSALICCDKFECLVACRNKLISESAPK